MLIVRGRDHDRKIIGELRRMLQVACKKLKERDPDTGGGSTVEQAFQKWDKHGTGKFTFFLFSSLVRQELHVMPAIISDEKLRMVFSCMDLDGNGTIELEEFVEFVTGKPPPGSNKDSDH